LYGLHSVEAAITFSLRKNLDLFVQMSYKQTTPSHIQKIIYMAKARNIKIKYLTAIKMDKFTGNRPHNGLVLKCESRDYLSIKTFNSIKGTLKKPKGNLLLLLDQIVDPQNLGSIIRTAFYLGTDGILLNKSNKPPINSTVCKVSSGASECIDLYSVKSVKSFLAEAVTQGWIVATTSIEKESEVQMRSNNRKIARDVQLQDSATESMTLKLLKPIEAKKISLEEFDLTKEDNIIVVLGSEANGILSDLSGVAHYNIFIPPRLNKHFISKAPFDIIDSLNVGVSAGIIINHVKSKLMFNGKN
jgi:tRNA G18 (ribose-2'-O)-methylase SpoU